MCSFMKMIETNCPNCHGQMKIDKENKTAVCPFCGTTALIDDETQHVQYDNAEDAGYNFEKGRQRAQAEAEAEQRRNYVYQRPQTVYVPVERSAPKAKKKPSGCLKVLIILVIIWFAGALITTIGSIIVSKTFKDAMVSSVAEEKDITYVSSIDDVTSEMEAELYSDAHDEFCLYMDEVFGSEAQINLAEYAGFYMVVPDDSDDAENYMYIIIHANVDYTPEGYETSNYDYYWYIRYSDVVVTEDGSTELSDDNHTLYVEHFLVPEHGGDGVYNGNGYYSIQEFYDTEIAPCESSGYVATSIDLGTPSEEAAPEGEAPVEG